MRSAAHSAGPTPKHGALFVWADGKRVHPQTITNRFQHARRRGRRPADPAA